MTIINFLERARLIRLQREFSAVTKTLQETRILLDYPLSPARRTEVVRQRKQAIKNRDRLEHLFDETDEGTQRKRRLLGRLPLEDLG